jgi:hypothetical protein
MRSIDNNTESGTRPILGLSLFFLATIVALIYALIGSGGILVFGLGKSLLDAYFLLYPFLFVLILLMALRSLHWMVALLLTNFIIYCATRVVMDRPYLTGLNPVQSYGDMLALSVIGLAVGAYLSFPTRLRKRGIISVFRDQDGA